MFKNKVAHIWEWFGDHTIKRLLKIRSEYFSRKKTDVDRSHSMPMGKKHGNNTFNLFEVNNKIFKTTTLYFV